MSFTCSNCGAEIQYQQPSCLNCGCPFDWSTTLPPQEPYGQQPPAAAQQVQYAQPIGQQQLNQTQAPYYQGQQNVQSGYAYAGASSAPLLQTWQVSIGATIAGIIVSSGFSGSSSIIENYQGNLANLIALSCVILVITLVITAFSLVYALVFYPSFFGPNPKLRSNTAISFLNGFTGGIIFGLIWNYNLSQKKKGVSYIVATVFAGIGILSGIAGLVALLSFL